MMWHLAILSMLVAHCLCCIPCDQRGKEAMDKYTILIQDQILEETLQGYMSIKQMAYAAQNQFLDYLKEEVQIMDKFAIADIVSEYSKAVNIIVQMDFKGVQLLHTIQFQFQILQERIKNIVEEAERRRCPNKQDFDNCGLLVQTYTHCETCEEEKIICAGGPPSNQEYFDKCSCVCTQHSCFDLKTGHQCTPCSDYKSYLENVINCGDGSLGIAEGEDLILKCNIDWYSRLEDGYKNLFYKNAEPEPKITDEANIEIRGVQRPDSGKYTCMTILNSGVPVAKFTYNVEVKEGESEKLSEEIENDPLPTLPDYLELPLPVSNMPTPEVTHHYHHGNNKKFLAICGAVAITMIVISAVICFIMWWWKNKKSALPQGEDKV
ncbi:izumo sperm-egg fusion protein 1-like isoform X1 [Dendropsophus ebraccatus]|uniref:izumo sperm-egg fusion protein 1-like isoform X1 n=2 Tax=Dendropsophus ebraccatus TaxID=150705 RepID=UPI0038311805